jgi:predicted dithiol-disulfide oxidoreductase (DUF899 family)
MQNHKVVSRGEWLVARQEHLANAKEFTRLRDQLSQARRELPWVKVEQVYWFDTPEGKQTLIELFAGRSQLIVYHFMVASNWLEGCPICSFWADNFNGIVVHLNQRDISFVAISGAPLEKLEAYKRRMGWSFPWVSSGSSDFNYDYQVSWTPAQMQNGSKIYRYRASDASTEDAPRVSVSYQNQQRAVFHPYFCYARGLDILNRTYHFIDPVPKGRDEAGLPWFQAWVRRRDRLGRP